MLSKKSSVIIKSMFLLIFLFFSLSASAHTTFSFSVGGAPVYYPAPVYYGPPAVVQNVVWVPAHWEYGYWVPAQYVEYVAPRPQPEVIWARGGYYGHHAHRYYY